MGDSSEHIAELTKTTEWKKAFPVIKQLRTHLTEDTYLELLEEMRSSGYRLFGMFVDDTIAAAAGVRINVNFYNFRHVFIYDLVTDSSYRSHGYGEKLLHYIHEWAKENGAEYAALESGIQRKDAHRFYEEKLHYEKWCYSFRKKI
ncbi:GNAT family N-acetyltransferase [Salibacterium aidingense]|uniref:GNAT family N-acetyltransferase n=1 Tax=Salibacterium aidingense TaxID=384933 RepID=UPI003BCFCC22